MDKKRLIYSVLSLTFVFLLLGFVQWGLINFRGTIVILDVNPSWIFNWLTRGASGIGKTIHLDGLAELYRSDIGPVVNDPTTHSVWDYWLGVTFTWVGLWASIILLIWVARILINGTFGRSTSQNQHSSHNHASTHRGPPGHENEPWLWDQYRAGAQLIPAGGFPQSVLAIPMVTPAPVVPAAPAITVAPVATVVAPAPSPASPFNWGGIVALGLVAVIGTLLFWPIVWHLLEIALYQLWRPITDQLVENAQKQTLSAVKLQSVAGVVVICITVVLGVYRQITGRPLSRLACAWICVGLLFATNAIYLGAGRLM